MLRFWGLDKYTKANLAKLLETQEERDLMKSYHQSEYIGDEPQAKYDTTRHLRKIQEKEKDEILSKSIHYLKQSLLTKSEKE